MKPYISMHKKLLCIVTLILIVSMFLQACSQNRDYDLNQEETVLETEVQTDGQTQLNVAEFDGFLNLQVILEQGYLPENIMYAGGDTLLISASNSAEPAEAIKEGDMRIYAANLATGNVWDKSINTGYIELISRSNVICDDGTVAILERMGEKSNILYVDPKTMSVDRLAIPIADLWEVTVSPQ